MNKNPHYFEQLAEAKRNPAFRKYLAARKRWAACWNAKEQARERYARLAGLEQQEWHYKETMRKNVPLAILEWNL